MIPDVTLDQIERDAELLLAARQDRWAAYALSLARELQSERERESGDVMALEGIVAETTVRAERAEAEAATLRAALEHAATLLSDGEELQETCKTCQEIAALAVSGLPAADEEQT